VEKWHAYSFETLATVSLTDLLDRVAAEVKKDFPRFHTAGCPHSRELLIGYCCEGNDAALLGLERWHQLAAAQREIERLKDETGTRLVAMVERDTPEPPHAEETFQAASEAMIEGRTQVEPPLIEHEYVSCSWIDDSTCDNHGCHYVPGHAAPCGKPAAAHRVPGDAESRTIHSNDMECLNCGRVVSINGCDFCVLDEGPEAQAEPPQAPSPAWTEEWAERNRLSLIRREKNEPREN